MSQTISSVDIFLDMDVEEEIENASDSEPSSGSYSPVVLDFRRKLEAKIAERRLERDIQEFEFDF